MKNILIKTLIVLVSVVVGCFVVDKIAQYMPQTLTNNSWSFVTKYSGINNFYSLDQNRIYKINPNASGNWFGYRSDRYGFRYNPFHEEKKPSGIKIIMVGDSFTYGHGVDHTFAYPYVVEQILRNEGYDVWVDNAGVSGYGLDQEYIYITNELLPTFTPQIIIWNVNINDVGDSNEACLFKKTQTGYKLIPGSYNTIYIFRHVISPIINKLPHPFVSSTLVSKILGTIPERFTIGCTEKTYENDAFVDKAAYLFNKIKTLAKQKNVQILINIVFNQLEFEHVPSYGSWEEQQLWVKQQKSLFIKASLASGFKPIDTINLLSLSDNQSNILGSTTYSGTNSEYFLHNDPVSNGWQHLNDKGNALMGTLVAAHLLPYVQNSSQSGSNQ